MRLLPVFSPGRALLWGTILAAWGTGAVVASSSRALDIRTVCGAPLAVGRPVLCDGRPCLALASQFGRHLCTGRSRKGTCAAFRPSAPSNVSDTHWVASFSKLVVTCTEKCCKISMQQCLRASVPGIRPVVAPCWGPEGLLSCNLEGLIHFFARAAGGGGAGAPARGADAVHRGGAGAV